MPLKLLLLIVSSFPFFALSQKKTDLDNLKTQVAALQAQVTTLEAKINAMQLHAAQLTQELKSLKPIATTSNGTALWLQKDQDDFMRECLKGTEVSMGKEPAKKYCACMIEKLKVKYPNPNDASSMNMTEMKILAKECLK